MPLIDLSDGINGMSPLCGVRVFISFELEMMSYHRTTDSMGKLPTSGIALDGVKVVKILIRALWNLKEPRSGRRKGRCSEICLVA